MIMSLIVPFSASKVILNPSINLKDKEKKNIIIKEYLQTKIVTKELV